MPAGDSFRQTIMDRIKARMSGIRRSAGYRTDIGRKGHEWKSTPFQDADIPGYDLRDVRDEKADAGGTRTAHTLRVEITAVVKGDEGKVPSQMRDAIADISQAIAVDPTWGLGEPDDQHRLVTSTDPISEESAEVIHEGKRYGVVSVAVVVNYITDRWGE